MTNTIPPMDQSLKDKIEETIEALSNADSLDDTAKELIRAMCEGCYVKGALAVVREIKNSLNL